MDEQPNLETSGAEETQPMPVAGQVKGENVQFGPGFAGAVSANQDLTMERAGAMVIAAGHNMNLSFGGATAIAVGANAEITNGGAMVMPVGANCEITNGGALLMPASNVTARNSVFGVVISGQTNLDESSRVLLDTKQAAAFGAAFGLVFALLSWLLRKK